MTPPRSTTLPAACSRRLADARSDVARSSCPVASSATLGDDASGWTGADLWRVDGADMLDVFDLRSNTFTGYQEWMRRQCGHAARRHVLLGCERGPIFDPTTGRLVGVANAGVLRQAGRRWLTGGSSSATPWATCPSSSTPDSRPTLPSGRTLMCSFGRPSMADSPSRRRRPCPTVHPRLRPNPYDRHPLQRGLAAIFDPRLGTFIEVASPAGRHLSTATLLPDGRILFVGKPDRSPDRTDPEPPAAELLDLGLPR